LAVHLTLGVLDPRSSFARLLAGTTTDRRVRNLFVLNQFAALQYAVVNRRPNCASCAVGPSPRTSNRPATPRPATPRPATPRPATPRPVRQVATAAPHQAWRPRLLTIVGGIGLIASAFLTWVRHTAITASRFPYEFLLQGGTSGNVTLLHILIGLGGLSIIIGLFAPRLRIRRLLGLLALAISALFIWRWYEWVGYSWNINNGADAIRTLRNLKDLLGVGVYVAGAAGVLILIR